MSLLWHLTMEADNDVFGHSLGRRLLHRRGDDGATTYAGGASGGEPGESSATWQRKRTFGLAPWEQRGRGGQRESPWELDDSQMSVALAVIEEGGRPQAGVI